MNDFTKEELKIMLSWRNDMVYTKKPTPQMIASNEKLGERIQSMIDNYCEHHFIFTLNDSSVHCHKCGKVLNEN